MTWCFLYSGEGFQRSAEYSNSSHKRRVGFLHCGDSSLWSRVDDFIVRIEVNNRFSVGGIVASDSLG